MKLTKTETKVLQLTKIIAHGYSIDFDKPLFVKAAKKLEFLGLVTLEIKTNEYGFKWLEVRALKKEKNL